MAALILKVGTLALKQLAKPFAERFQSYVMSHPTARKHVISASQVGQCRWAAALPWAFRP
jgi:hypothetical protein